MDIHKSWEEYTAATERLLRRSIEAINDLRADIRDIPLLKERIKRITCDIDEIGTLLNGDTKRSSFSEIRLQVEGILDRLEKQDKDNSRMKFILIGGAITLVANLIVFILTVLSR